MVTFWHRSNPGAGNRGPERSLFLSRGAQLTCSMLSPCPHGFVCRKGVSFWSPHGSLWQGSWAQLLHPSASPCPAPSAWKHLGGVQCLRVPPTPPAAWGEVSAQLRPLEGGPAKSHWFHWKSALSRASGVRTVAPWKGPLGI